MRIRRITLADLDICQKIGRQASHNVGRVWRDKLLAESFVAEVEGEVVGFVNYHARQDGWQTIYHIAVHHDFQGKGIGRALLYAVPCPIQLDCVQGNPANEFFVNAGMRLAGIEEGNRSPLNVYEMRILAVIVRGARTGIADLARQTGMAYGTRHDLKPQGWPFMVDIHWEKVKKKGAEEWAKVLKVIADNNPIMAMCQDWEPEVPYATIQQQIADLRNLDVQRIMICPKQDGIMHLIPQDCIVAVSIPTDYAGYLPDPNTLRSRKIHLLGGTPQQQKEYIVKYTGHGGRVISVDGNKHIGVAQKGTTYANGKWRKAKRREKVDIAACSFYSSHNLRYELNAAAEYQQMPLWQNKELADEN